MSRRCTKAVELVFVFICASIALAQKSWTADVPHQWQKEFLLCQVGVYERSLIFLSKVTCYSPMAGPSSPESSVDCTRCCPC